MLARIFVPRLSTKVKEEPSVVQASCIMCIAAWSEPRIPLVFCLAKALRYAAMPHACVEAPGVAPPAAPAARRTPAGQHAGAEPEQRQQHQQKSGVGSLKTPARLAASELRVDAGLQVLQTRRDENTTSLGEALQAWAWCTDVHCMPVSAKRNSIANGRRLRWMEACSAPSPSKKLNPQIWELRSCDEKVLFTC